ncbi:acetate/propionate family kinase [Pseudoxanthomonas sacheonensis]|uniref:acetate/propionate family kinase n=1 Tax=Pseudoxanthomonas sacheonensis TaxID=443615 RepID=UPI0013D13823|nr:acetate kinase [Pseudoxanthomonas sacheonensis]KAF1710723.1 acetate kinase [Pseudoxanthomonas sacheonensis]
MTASGEGSLLVLNLGSATLKAARFDGFGLGTERPGRPQRIEIALDQFSGDPRALLAQATDALGFAATPAWVGHRIVHGGDAEAARILDAGEIDRLHALASLAPMHQPPALALVESAAKLWPHAVQCGAYDTVWHAALPANTRRLPVPQRWDALGVRRYGFHGLAFASAMRLLANQDDGIVRGRVVLAHLGGGSSLCAAQDGCSVDTTMAMTPLDGVPMATRSGSLDPGALFFLLRQEGFTVDSLEQALYHECGMRGISGQSGDMRELLASDSPAAELAREVFALRVAQGIAGMATRLSGIDDLVFSGGIGANAADVRSSIVKYLAWLGMQLDHDANHREATRLDAPASLIRIWRVEVDEESEIATACAHLVTSGP